VKSLARTNHTRFAKLVLTVGSFLLQHRLALLAGLGVIGLSGLGIAITLGITTPTYYQEIKYFLDQHTRKAERTQLEQSFDVQPNESAPLGRHKPHFFFWDNPKNICFCYPNWHQAGDPGEKKYKLINYDYEHKKLAETFSIKKVDDFIKDQEIEKKAGKYNTWINGYRRFSNKDQTLVLNVNNFLELNLYSQNNPSLKTYLGKSINAIHWNPTNKFQFLLGGFEDIKGSNTYFKLTNRATVLIIELNNKGEGISIEKVNVAQGIPDLIETRNTGASFSEDGKRLATSSKVSFYSLKFRETQMRKREYTLVEIFDISDIKNPKRIDFFFVNNNGDKNAHDAISWLPQSKKIMVFNHNHLMVEGIEIYSIKNTESV